MTRISERDYEPVAHDGDWFYMVAGSDLEKAAKLAEKITERRSRVGSYLAAWQLKRLVVGRRLDPHADDTFAERKEPEPLSAQELSAEILKTTQLY